MSWRKKTVLFLISQSVTLFGSTLVQMAIVWYVTLRTSSGAWVSAFTVCAYLPQFLVSFAGGVLADRVSRKWLIIGADAAIAAVTLLLALMMPHMTTDTPLLTALLVATAVRSIGAGIQTPAVNAVMPQLVPQEKLMRWNGVNATMQSVVQFAAPAAAGVILSFGTLRETLFVDVLTAIAGVGLLVFLAIPRTEPPAEKTSVLADMKGGLVYVARDGFLSRLIGSYGLFIFLSVPAGFLATLYVSRMYGDTYWYLTAVELVGFAGMTAGGLLMSVWGGFRKRTGTLLWALCAFGLLAVGMGLAKSFYLYLALMLLYGVALTAVQTATTTLLQEHTHPSVQGRVFGLLGTMYAGFLPLGMAVFGPVSDRIALPWLMVGSGGLLLLVALVLRLDRRFQQKET